MIIIKNSKELAKLVDENKDLFLREEDVRIEYQIAKGEIRDIYCGSLYLENDKMRFDFNGNNFNGWNFNGFDFNGNNFNGFDFNGNDFNGNNFNGWDFNGNDFNGNDFNGWNFNGFDFNGNDISYYAFFICYKNIKCKSWEKRRENAKDPICLDGKLEIIEETDNEIKKAIKLLEEKGLIVNGKILK